MKKLILILLMVFGIAGIASAGWWSIVQVKWDDVGADSYVVEVRMVRDDGTVRNYQFETGNVPEIKLDVEPDSTIYVEVYADGGLMSEISFRSHSFKTTGEETIRF